MVSILVFNASAIHYRDGNIFIFRSGLPYLSAAIKRVSLETPRLIPRGS